MNADHMVVVSRPAREIYPGGVGDDGQENGEVSPARRDGDGRLKFSGKLRSVCSLAVLWKIGTIASELSVHPDTVRNAIESERFRNTPPLRASIVDPYADFVRQTLDQ